MALSRTPPTATVVTVVWSCPSAEVLMASRSPLRERSTRTAVSAVGNVSAAETLPNDAGPETARLRTPTAARNPLAIAARGDMIDLHRSSPNTDASSVTAGRGTLAQSLIRIRLLAGSTLRPRETISCKANAGYGRKFPSRLALQGSRQLTQRNGDPAAHALGVERQFDAGLQRPRQIALDHQAAEAALYRAH